MRRWLPLLALGLARCAVVDRPARFLDAPTVEDVGDEGPTPIPRPLDPVKEMVLSEAYVERPMVEALDPKRIPEPGDVNALDEVPRSSWLSPDEVESDADAAETPAPPFRLLAAPAVTREDALAVMDARGRRFELWRDPADRPEMSTGAAVAASQLLRDLGYFTPGVWAVDVVRDDFVLHDAADEAAVLALFRKGPPAARGAFRIAATRWPIGVDLGPTPAEGKRDDDPNDRVPHQNRRTLRALQLVFGWLGMTEADASVLRDAYVGAPGRGHAVHYIAGMGGALGADAVVRPHGRRDRDEDADLSSRNVWITLGTLGLYQPKPHLTPQRWPSIGEYRETWSPGAFQTSPPLAAIDRAVPADTYWAAKRIARVSTTAVVRALDAGHYHDDSARALLGERVRERQALAVQWGFAQVTPCEVDRLDPATKTSRALLVLRDEAVALGVVAASTTTVYRINLVDETGNLIAEPLRMRMTGGALFPVLLPADLPPYVVLRVTVTRGGKRSPRPMEVHLVHQGEALRVVGVVH
jgi:hypothetical protein